MINRSPISSEFFDNSLLIGDFDYKKRIKNVRKLKINLLNGRRKSVKIDLNMKM